MADDNQVVAKKGNDLLSLLKRYERQIGAAVPKHLTADTMLQLVIGAVNKTPDLLRCTPGSVLNSVMHLAQLGLRPVVNEAYLLPFNVTNPKTTTRTMTCTPVIDYRGKIKLARQSGLVKDIEPHIVYARDKFDLKYGTDPQKRGLVHEPLVFMRKDDGTMGRVTAKDRGDAVLGYVIGWLKDGETHVEVMTYADIEHIRSKSRTGSSGAWVTDWDQMANKTLVHRICKMLPWSGELGDLVQRAQELDNAVDIGQIIDPIVELEPGDDRPLVTDGSEEQAAVIAAQKIAEAKAARQREMEQPVVDENGDIPNDAKEPEPTLFGGTGNAEPNANGQAPKGSQNNGPKRGSGFAPRD